MKRYRKEIVLDTEDHFGPQLKKQRDLIDIPQLLFCEIINYKNQNLCKFESGDDNHTGLEFLTLNYCRALYYSHIIFDLKQEGCTVRFNTNESFGIQFKNLRKSHELTQKELGEMMGCHLTSIGHFELGKNSSVNKLNTLFKYVKALGVGKIEMKLY